MKSYWKIIKKLKTTTSLGKIKRTHFTYLTTQINFKKTKENKSS